jgi:hypothetical protein
MNSRRNSGQTKELLLSAKLRTELERSRTLCSQLQTELRLMTEIVASYRQSAQDEPLFDMQLRHSKSRQTAEGSEGNEEDDQQVVPTVYIDALKLYPKTSTAMEMVHKALVTAQQQQQQQQQHGYFQQQQQQAFQRQPSHA